MMGLVTDDVPRVGLHAGPLRPTLIPELPARPIAFASLGDLAREIERQRKGRGLQFRKAHATYDGSDTFPIFKVFWLVDDDAEYAFSIAVQFTSREALQAAMAAVAAPARAGAKRRLTVERASRWSDAA